MIPIIMSLQPHIDTVKTQNPLWKSNSRIIGRAGEIYSCEKLQCLKCNEIDWLECTVNSKSKDQICKNCGKKYQIKCKNITEKLFNNIKKNSEFKTIGAEFNTTLKSIEDQIDYIIILYKKSNFNILDIIHIKSEDITCDNIIPRKPLSNNAKRAGWQGCNLYFTNLNFINPVF
jgi:type II restriction enzyme